MLGLLEPKVLCTFHWLAELNKNDTVSSTEEANDGLDKIVTQMVNVRTDHAMVPPLFYGESHYDSLIKRRVKIKDYTFQGTTPKGTQVMHSADIFATYLTKADAAGLGAKLKNQLFFNGNLKLTITMQGAPQSYGQLVFFAVPTPRSVGEDIAAKIPGFGLVKAKSFPHVVMDPSKACTCELSLPCPTPSGVWLKTSGSLNQSNSYSLYSIVYNPLASGTAAAITAVEGTIYVSFEDMIPGPVTLLSDSFAESGEKTGPLSGPATAVAKAADALSVIPVIGPYMTITSGIASGAASFLKMLGFSRPFESNPNQLVLNKTTTTYGTFNAKSYHTPLATDAANGISLSPMFSGGGNLGEMSIPKLCGEKSYIDAVAFSPTSSPGFLWSSRVSPTVVHSPSPGVYELSNLAYMALPFVVWHGEITYTFEIVCSTFHRAIIGIAYDPGAAAPTDWETAVQTLKTEIITVSGNTVIEFNAPWQQPSPFLGVRQVDVAPTLPGNGHISLFLLSPLESNGSTDSVDINVYVHSNSMKFAIPDISALAETEFLFVDVGDTGLDESAPSLDSDKVTLLSEGCQLINVEVPDSFGTDNDDDFFVRFFGENVAVSTKKVAAKLSPAWTGSLGDASYTGTTYSKHINFNYQPRWVGDSVVDPTVKKYNTYYSWYAIGYKGVRGTVNISVVPTDSNPEISLGMNNMWLTLFSQDAAPPTSRDDHSFSRNQSIGYPNIHPTNDVSIPHYCLQGYFYPTCMLTGTGGPGATFGYSTSEEPKLWCLKSLGDDGMFVNYLGPPVIKIPV